MRTDVLICGAGPTGLALALRLARAGVRARIVDEANEPGTTSRALVVHARTLELYSQMGLAEAFSREGRRFEAVSLWVGGRRVARVEIGALGLGLSPYPHVMVCAQDRHERFLAAQLEREGIAVERATALLDFEQSQHAVRGRLRGPRGEEICEASYLIGCDGIRSRVREGMGAAFPGGTYSRVFYVADVEAAGSVVDGQLHIALDDVNFVGVFPLLGGTTARLIGTVEAEHEAERETLSWETVGARAAARIGVEVLRINWFSTYRVHHRVASHFRDRRVFLAGDAAHVHSPAGGQGMNTGIGDAINLAWKLAEVVTARAGEALLDSYEPERSAFARRLVATTDRAFAIATSTGPLARFVRRRVLPVLLPRALRLRAVRRLLFRTLSQTAISYRGSALSRGRAGDVHGGDRLPYAGDNFDRLDSRWQVHVYGDAAPDLRRACAELRLPLHEIPWSADARRAGFARGALYLVRPDGHVALADPAARAGALQEYVKAVSGGAREIGQASPARSP